MQTAEPGMRKNCNMGHRNRIKTRLFLVGCARSGTTLLQSLVASHPQIESFPESNFFPSVAGDINRRRYDLFSGSLKNKLSYLLRDLRLFFGIAWPHDTRALQRIHEFLRDIHRDDLGSIVPRYSPLMKKTINTFVEILDRLTLEKNKEIWLEKSPSHLYYIDVIERFVEDVKFLHILRNGSNVVASIYDAANKYKGGKHDFSDNIDLCIKQWNVALSITLNNRNTKNHKLIIYEELVLKPEEKLEEICEFVGVYFDKEILNRYGKTAKRIALSSEPWKANVKQPIKSANATKFYSLFNEQQRQYIIKNLLPY
jgi:hypothetical protein